MPDIYTLKKKLKNPIRFSREEERKGDVEALLFLNFSQSIDWLRGGTFMVLICD